MKNKIGLGLLAGMGAGLSLLTLAAPNAKAQTATYASSRRQIKACVLIPSKNAPLFPPYAFYELDSRTDIKPGEWDILNPLAFSTLSGAGFQRWSGNSGASTDGYFAQNAPLAKNMAPYWEADLSVISDDDLRKMDIALLPLSGPIQLTDVERERLIRFVDGGGVLWVELEANGFGINNFIFDISNGGAGSPSFYHPLLNFPNVLSGYDVARITAGAGSASFPNTTYMYPVTTGGSIAAGDYGAGHIIVSSSPIAKNINFEITNSGQNIRSAPQFDSDLKFLANMIAWSSAAPTQGSNARRTGSTGERVGTRLGEKWTWANIPNGLNIPSNPMVGKGSGAVIYKGLVFYVDSSNILHAFARDPGTVNGGNIADFSKYGTPYNEMFNSTKPVFSSGRVSTPTVATVIDSKKNPQDYVAVTNEAGNTAIYKFGNGGFSPNPFLSPAATGGGALPGTIPVPSPIFSEGLFFAVTSAPANTGTTGVWRIVPLNTDGTNAFQSGGGDAVAPYANTTNGAAFAGMPDLTGPISAGYIKDNATGAVDKVIYCPTIPPTLGPNMQSFGVIAAMWFNTKAEPLTPFVIAKGRNFAFKADGDRSKAPWYLGGAGDALNPVLHITHRDLATGALTYATLNYPADFAVVRGGLTLAQDPNNPTKPLPSAETDVVLNTALGDGDEVHADYTLNWPGNNMTDGSGGPVAMTANDMRVIGRAYFTAAPTLSPGGGAGTIQTVANIIGGVAISQQDLAIFNTTFTGGVNGNTGRIYGLREQYGNSAISRSATGTKGIGTQVAWTFSPEPSKGTLSNFPSRLRDNDTYSGLGTGTYLTNFTPVGSPAIANDTVYVVGTANNSQATVIMALRANPSMTITLGANSGIPQPLPIGWEVRIFNRAQQQGDTDWFNQAPHLLPSQFTLDPDSGNISIFDCRLSDGNVLNLGEPIVIGVQPTQVIGPKGAVSPPPIIVILPNPNNPNEISPLDNLAWFMAIPTTAKNALPPNLQGISPSSGPSIIGDSLYFGTTNGGIASVDLRGFGQQHYLHVTNPPLNNNGSLGGYDNSDSNLRVHLMLPQIGNQPPIGGLGASLEPPTGTERTLVMGMPQGLTVFDSRATLIADGTRLLEVDYGGNALWTMDSTLSYVFDGSGNSVTTKTNLARPGVAHRIGQDQFFFADTNNNRVTLADRGGKTLWELTSFNNDMGFVPPGYPLTLNAPTDVEFHQDNYPGYTISSPKGAFAYSGDVVVNRYLVADSGNFRLLEIIDILDAKTGNPITLTDGAGDKAFMQRQVTFVSKSLGEQNLKHRYRTIQEFAVPNPNGGSPTLYIVSAIANTARSTTGGNVSALTAAGSNQEGLGGSVEVLRRDLVNYQNDGAPYAVFTSLILPQTSNGALVMTGGKVAIKAYVPLNNVTYCKGFYVASADEGQNSSAAYPLNQFHYQYMIADSSGCYVVNSNGVILWMLTSADYFNMTGRPLRASSIQRLTQTDINIGPGIMDGRPWYPRFLITNRYEGPDSLPELINVSPSILGRGQIHGEVFEIRSLDYEQKGAYGGMIYNGALVPTLGGPVAITWLFPNEKKNVFYPTKPPTLYSIERFIGNPNNATSTSLLQQPTYAERTN